MTSRALVLGGGGVVGIAWETGVLAGLYDAGINLAAADLIVGTSAGSVVGVQLAAGRSPHDLYARQLAPSDGGIERSMAADDDALRTIFRTWAYAPAMTEQLAAEIGEMALAVPAVDENQWVAAINARLGVADWPQGHVLITAVDALTGAFVAWDRTSGVPLARAVASSCAVPGLFPPVTVAGRRYIDGGVRSGASADLARGNDLVLVVAPIGASPRSIGRISREALDGEVAKLRAAGSTVEVLMPDEPALDAFGPNLMNPSRRTAAAKAGRRQGTMLADRLRASAPPW